MGIFRIVCFIASFAIHCWVLYRKIAWSLDNRAAWRFFGRHWLFLTTWGMIMVNVYFSLAVFLPFHMLHEATSFFLQCAVLVQLVVVPGYWAIDYAASFPKTHERGLPPPSLFKEICLHGVLGMFIWVEFAVSSVPLVADHGFYIVSWMLGYTLVNCIAAQIIGPIYPKVTWKDRQSFALFGVLCFTFIALIPALHEFRSWSHGPPAVKPLLEFRRPQSIR